jgi:hypothetical protein
MLTALALLLDVDNTLVNSDPSGVLTVHGG